MSDSRSLLLASWRDLKARFRAIRKPYRATIFHLDWRGSHQIQKIVERRTKFGLWFSTPIEVPELHLMRRNADGSEVELPEHRIKGFLRSLELESPKNLGPICEDAALLLAAFPPSLNQRLWAKLPLPHSRRTDWSIWCAAVFELAWQQIPGSTLRAAKSFAVNENSTAPLEEIRRLAGYPRFLDAEKMKGLGDEWFSRFDDFAAASVKAVDIVLNWLEAEAAIEPPKSVESQAEILAVGEKVGSVQGEATKQDTDKHDGQSDEDLMSAIERLTPSAKGIVLVLGKNDITKVEKRLNGLKITQLPRSGLKYNTSMKEGLSSLQHLPFEFLENPGRGYYLTERGIAAYEILKRPKGQKQKSGQSRG